jgi:hypothetical protein
VIWIPGRTLTGEGKLSTLTGEHAESFNDVDHPDDVSISDRMVPVNGDKCILTLPPHSVSTLRLPSSPI